MQLDAHNKILVQAKATGLIFSVRFHFSLRGAFAIPKCIQGILHGLATVLICVSFILAYSDLHCHPYDQMCFQAISIGLFLCVAFCA